jgi:hypothetical protein
LQFERVFVNPWRLAKVKLRVQDSRANLWGHTITEEFNHLLRTTKPYIAAQKNKWQSTILHGLGAMVWFSDWDWYPQFVGLDDVKFPSRTLSGLENCPHFSVLRRYTAAEAYYRIIDNENADPGWNKKHMKRLVNERISSVAESLPTDDWEQWQTLDQDYRTDTGLLASDVIPTVNIWHLFYLGEDGWEQVGVTLQGSNEKFAYRSVNPVAKNINQILHLQVADAGMMVPKRVASVTGLGRQIYGSTHIYNRMMCEIVESAFENATSLYQTNDGDDTERPVDVQIRANGILPNNLRPIPTNERHIPDWQFQMSVVQAMRAQSDEHSAGWMLQGLKQSGAEKSATQAQYEMAYASAPVESMMAEAYPMEEELYREIGRRLHFDEAKEDRAVKRFFEECVRMGVPETVLYEPDLWDVSVPKQLGGGNEQIGAIQADKLLQMRSAFEPEAQRTILREWTFQTTQNPSLTMELVPEQPEQNSPTKQIAEAHASQLFQGIPASLPPGINIPEYAQYLLSIVAERAALLEEDAEPDKSEVAGAHAALEHAVGFLAQMAQDPTMQQVVNGLKQLVDAVNQSLRKLASRVSEQMQQRNGNGADPTVPIKVEQAKLDLQQDMELHAMDVESKRTRMAFDKELAALRVQELRNKIVQETQRRAKEDMQQDQLQEPLLEAAEAREEAQEITVEIKRQELENKRKQGKTIGQSKQGKARPK